MEVFSHVHPAVMPRPLACVPVLRVCRYWRSLLFRTPHFWSNLLGLPSWKLWNRRHQLCRFKAALWRSGSTTLSLSVPYCDKVIANILTSEASRIASLKVGPTMQCRVKNIAQVLERDMPRLTHLAILQSSGQHSESTLNIDFSRHRNVRVLELERTYIFTPISPYASLSHLKLQYCVIRPAPTSDDVRTLYAVHNALEFFPNLETLSITHCLADDDPSGLSGPPPEPTKTIELPRLRLLELHDIPTYMIPFLSRLAFPPTTALVLEPAYRRDRYLGAPPVPLFPGINPAPTPSPHASLSLHLDFTNPHASHAFWKTHCDPNPSDSDGTGATIAVPVRPVRVVLPNAAGYGLLVAQFSRELAGALGPLTTLTARGASGAWAYWGCVLPALPRLRSLAYDAGREETKEVVDLLGTRTVCPELVRLGLVWHVPPRVEVGEPGVWRALSVLGRGGEDGDSDRFGGGDAGLPMGRGRGRGGRDEEEDVARSLGRFCDALRASLVERASGTCERIREVVVAPRQWRYDGTQAAFEEWQMALAEQRLRERLGDLVEDITIVKDLY
ncbi:hypothetical protein GSI_10143 [Ganoderma sinense ZZ0214-1]|uniref:F-box domain-containing protein n=1 Tax=Ganoderma sinense ZZ0214-1 TaxID=1077348 RepID=A0A2G8RZT8_9APHY|nr:hypothetical protein GSI_10143 [Ganoderma sinense ZZ0214-1]